MFRFCNRPVLQKNTEIICIDDCSIDSSYSICKNYSDADNGIIVKKNSENIGVSRTRNVGLDMASGDCVCFVDSDDYILPEMFETMMKYMNDYDCCVCQFAREYSTGTREEYSKIYNELENEYTHWIFISL